MFCKGAQNGSRILALKNIQSRWMRAYSIQHENRIVESSANFYKQRRVTRRPLDGLESMFHEYHKTGIGFSYLLVPITSKVPIEENALKQALTMVSYSQPLLRATISENSGLKYFECMEGRANFGFSTLDRDIQDTEGITEEIFASTKFESDDGPLWKAVLIPGKFDQSSNSYNGGLVLAISHAVANAPSLPVVLNQTLAYLEDIKKGTAPKLEDISSHPLYPSSATLLSHKLAVLEPTTPIQPSAEYINPVLSQFPTIEDQPQRPESHTKVIIRAIQPHQAVSLLQKCRKNNSTVTGALLAACHTAFGKLLQTNHFPANATNDITCLAAVHQNHRPSLPEDYVACHYGSLTYDVPLPSADTKFWEIAASLSHAVRNDVRGEKHLNFLSTIEADSRGYMEQVLHQGSSKLASRQKSSLILSNCGQFFAENSAKNLFHPEALIVGTPIHKRFGTFGNYLMTLNGKTAYMFCYDASIISSEIAQRYSDSVWKALDLEQHEMQSDM